MTAAVSTAPTATDALPTGLYQIHRNGRPDGAPFHFLDLAQQVVLYGRRLDPTATYTLTDARTGQRLAADEAEWQTLLIEQFEAAEAAEGWGASPGLHHEGITLYADATLPQAAFDWSELKALVEKQGKVRIGDVSRPVLIDLAQELRKVGLTVKPLGRQMLEVTLAKAPVVCGDCLTTEDLVKLSCGRLICEGCREQLDQMIGPTEAVAR